MSNKFLRNTFTVANSNLKSVVFLLADSDYRTSRQYKGLLDEIAENEIRVDNIRRYAESPFTKYGFWLRKDQGNAAHTRSGYRMSRKGEDIVHGVAHVLRWASLHGAELEAICGISYNATEYTSPIENIASILREAADGIALDALSTVTAVERLKRQDMLKWYPGSQMVQTTQYGKVVLRTLIEPVETGRVACRRPDLDELSELCKTVPLMIRQREPAPLQEFNMMMAVANNPGIGYSALSAKLDMHPSTVRYYARRLHDAGKIVNKGETAASYFVA